MTRKNRFSLNLVSIVTVAIAGVWIYALLGQADEVIHVLGGIYLKGWKIAIAIATTAVVWNVALQYFVRRSLTVGVLAGVDRAELRRDGDPIFDESLLTDVESEHGPNTFDPSALETLVLGTVSWLNGDLEDPFPRNEAPVAASSPYTAHDRVETKVGLGPALVLTPGPCYAELPDAVEGEENTEPQRALPSSNPPPPATEEEDQACAPTLRDRALMDAMAAMMHRDEPPSVNAQALSDARIDPDPDPEAVLMSIVERIERQHGSKSAVA